MATIILGVLLADATEESDPQKSGKGKYDRKDADKRTEHPHDRLQQ